MKIKKFLVVAYMCCFSSICSAQIHVNFFDIRYDISPDSLKKIGFKHMMFGIAQRDTLTSLTGGNKDSTVIFDIMSEKRNPNYGKIVSQTVIIKNMNNRLEIFFGNNFQVLTKPESCGYFLVRYKRNNHLYVCFLSEHVLSLTTLFPTAFLLDDYTIPELIK
ncbi:MAG TPA: hypothetical protein VKB95_16690 [Chitinophagaceae bacterium]|nr:hypothetical protein [Chitinophagaceae bacterium]